LAQITGVIAAVSPHPRPFSHSILQPLGMAETSYPDTPHMPEPFAHGYAADPGSPNLRLRDLTRSNPIAANAAGAMVSTLADLRVWARELAVGSLLSPATQAERLAVNPLSDQPGFTLGYGLGIMDLNGFSGHTGAIFGCSTWLLHAPTLDATLVVLANRGETQTEFAGKIAVDILHLLCPEQFPRAAGEPVAATPTS
jgi:D-alanyl-D-alanine carboxypeptidase